MAEAIQWIHAEKLCVLTGLTDARHRQLAKEGFFPSPVDANYQLVPTIQGLFRYYRETANRGKNRLDALKAGKLERETRKLDIELDRAARKLIAVADVDQMLLHIGSLQKVVLFQKFEREMPVRTDGKSTTEKQVIGRAMADELCAIFSSETDKWKDALDQPEPIQAPPTVRAS